LTENFLKEFPGILITYSHPAENVLSSAHRTGTTGELGADAGWYSNILVDKIYLVPHRS
jgi:hypothetical protein